jgi:hypothetical protein
MSLVDQFWIVIFLVAVIGLITGHLIERRRVRGYEEFEAKRRARKGEVERAARKTL